LTFFDLLRYLNGTQIAKTRRTMRRRLNALLGQQNDQPEQSENEPGAAEDAESTETETTVFPQHQQPKDDKKEGVVSSMAPVFTRFSSDQRLREALLRHRVRPHLFSGIEFEMFVCIVAPLTALVSLFAPWPHFIIPVSVFAGAALMLFEAVLVVKLWLDTRVFEAGIRQLTAAAEAEANAAASGPRQVSWSGRALTGLAGPLSRWTAPPHGSAPQQTAARATRRPVRRAGAPPP